MAAGLSLVPEGEATPLLEAMEAALDDVAAAMDGPAEAPGPFTAATSACELADAFGDGRFDAPRLRRQARKVRAE